MFIKRAIIGGGGWLAASYPFLIEPYLIQVNHYEIPVPNLPKAFTGYKILQLTDLHLGLLVPEILIRNVVRKANNLAKDLIVCTGDYINQRNKTDQIDRVWPLLSNLSAKDGVFSVLGNHDHWADTKRSLYWLKKSGQDIRHKAHPIDKNGARIWIGGAGDYWEDDIGIDQAFQGVPQKACKIVLAHNPDTADTLFETRIDLMICGHTHGGQVRIPLLGTPVLPVVNKRYTSGFIKTPKLNLFISRGIGWAIVPVRFNCRPEISILELTPETSQNL